MRVTTKMLPAIIGGAMMAGSIPAVQAMDGMVSAGTDFTDVNIGMGQQSTGLYINSGWVKNNNNGREVADAETGINLAVGPAMVNLGVQANYIKGATGAGEGVVFPIGGGVKLPLGHGVGIYASAYSASRQLSNSAKNYLDVDGGLSWTPVELMTLKAGYRYISMDGKNNHPNERLVDGALRGRPTGFLSVVYSPFAMRRTGASLSAAHPALRPARFAHRAVARRRQAFTVFHGKISPLALSRFHPPCLCHSVNPRHLPRLAGVDPLAGGAVFGAGADASYQPAGTPQGTAEIGCHRRHRQYSPGAAGHAGHYHGGVAGTATDERLHSAALDR